MPQSASPPLHPDPIRVLFLSHSSGLYGAQRQLLDLVEGARNLGVVPLVGLPGDGPLALALARLGVATLRLPSVSWRGEGSRFARRYLRTRLAAPAFARAVARLDVDLVHSNTERSALGALAARRLGLPHVWHLHALQHGWLAPANAWVRSVVARSVSATTARVVVPSESLAQEVRPYAPAPAAQVVPNGLLRSAERRPLAPWRPSREVRLLTVGRPKEWETSIDVLSRIVAAGREATLTFVGGEAGTVERIRLFAQGRGQSSRVRFVERVDDPRPFYEDADVLLHPSSYESFGRVLVEAMAVGLPVVAHRVGGIPEVVRDGETGWLTEVGDAAAMAEIALRVVDRLRESETRREAAYQDAWERFRVEPFAAGLAKLYRECLD